MVQTRFAGLDQRLHARKRRRGLRQRCLARSPQIDDRIPAGESANPRFFAIPLERY
jgi:hypothetical protein